MHASVRQYKTSDAAEVGRRANDENTGFTPLARAIQGFQAWYLIDNGDGTITTVTVCDDEAGVNESVEKARGWVGENAADLVEGTPNVTNGEVAAQAT
jgi:hypothetical protein